jgi:hypothetical protein
MNSIKGDSSSRSGEDLQARDGGRPAFPCEWRGETGLDMRDYFAAKAMAGFIASWPNSGHAVEHIQLVAAKSYQFADAMLAARGKS